MREPPPAVGHRPSVPLAASYGKDGGSEPYSPPASWVHSGYKFDPWHGYSLMMIRCSAALLLAAATLLAACSDGADDNAAAPADAASTATSEGQSLGRVSNSRGGWPAEADELCATLIARFHAAQRPGDASRAYSALDEAARVAKVDLEVLESLEPPPLARHGRDVIVAALAVQVIALQELAEATADGSEARARIALDRAADARERARPFAARLGLEACARAAVR